MKSNVEELIKLDIEVLYEKVGMELSSGLGLGDSDSDSNRSRGRRWFNKNREELRAHVCDSHVGKLSRTTERQFDQVLLVAAIADLIIPVVIGISPVTVATLLVKEGLTRLCESSEG